MEALEKYIASKKNGPSSKDEEGSTFDAAVDELMAAMKGGDKAAVGSALRAAVMECNAED